MSLDVLLVLLEVAHNVRGAPSVLFDRDLWNGEDGSLLESFGYLQLGGASVLVLVLWIRHRVPVLLIWSIVLAVFMLDDSALLHERFAGFLSTRVDLPSILGARPIEFGEIMAWTMICALFAILLSVFHVRAPGEAQRISRGLLIRTAILGGFAVGLDVMHELLAATGQWTNIALGILEDGGEIASMTLLLLYCLNALLEDEAVETNFPHPA